MAVDFATFSDLKRFTNDLTLNEQAVLKATASTKSAKDTFLSHSSKDAEYLPGVIKLLTPKFSPLSMISSSSAFSIVDKFFDIVS